MSVLAHVRKGSSYDTAPGSVDAARGFLTFLGLSGAASAAGGGATGTEAATGGCLGAFGGDAVAPESV